MEMTVLEKARFLPIVIWEAVEVGQNTLRTENARNHAAKVKMENARMARQQNRLNVIPAIAQESENGPNVQPLAAAGSKTARARACLAKTAKERNHKRGNAPLIVVQNGLNGPTSEFVLRHVAEERPHAREAANSETIVLERAPKLFHALKNFVRFGVSGQTIQNAQFLAETENRNARENAKMETCALEKHSISGSAREARVRNGRHGANSLPVQNHAEVESQLARGNALTGLKV